RCSSAPLRTCSAANTRSRPRSSARPAASAAATAASVRCCCWRCSRPASRRYSGCRRRRLGRNVNAAKGWKMPDVIDVVPVTTVHSPDWNEATRLLEQAVKAGNQDAQALYLLAMAYKHQGRFADARHILGKIAEPDSNVLLQ